MSLAFEKFMMQYKMVGSEKADGYSRSAFVGLTEIEKNIVFDYLVSELPWSVEWLFFLDLEKAALIVREKEAELRGNRHAHVYLLQKQLVNQCGDMKYQLHMIDDYQNYSDELKPLAVDAIAMTPVNSSTISLFKKIILVETNEDALASASVHFLDSMGLSHNTEDEKKIYHRLLDDLRSENSLLKIRTIDKVIKIKQA